ncbi:hypothetical protein AGMMS49928_27750 [Spirochaetia bacterium]|nr:hypothetical protein AGMMS49928_27750 [Spirochaetia bacterium]
MVLEFYWGGTYYYKVAAYNDNGYGPQSAAIMVSIVPPTITPLISTTSVKASLTSIDPIHWYSFNAVAGTTYNVQWDNVSQGEGDLIADVIVSAYQDDGTPLFEEVRMRWSDPQTITGYTGLVYIKVVPRDFYSFGPYGIQYY